MLSYCNICSRRLHEFVQWRNDESQTRLSSEMIAAHWDW